MAQWCPCCIVPFALPPDMLHVCAHHQQQGIPYRWIRLSPFNSYSLHSPHWGSTWLFLKVKWRQTGLHPLFPSRRLTSSLSRPVSWSAGLPMPLRARYQLPPNPCKCFWSFVFLGNHLGPSFHIHTYICHTLMPHLQILHLAFPVCLICCPFRL